MMSFEKRFLNDLTGFKPKVCYLHLRIGPIDLINCEYCIKNAIKESERKLILMQRNRNIYSAKIIKENDSLFSLRFKLYSLKNKK